jgi:hypothetical protein
MSEKIAAKLHRIENSLLGVENNTEIQMELSKYGYTADRMKEGKLLLLEAIRLEEAKTEEYSDQYVATGEAGKRWTAVYAQYMITLKVTRVAFKSQPGMLARFNATGTRSRSLSGWLNDARTLYDNMLKNPDAVETMAHFGYTAERLQRELQEVNEVAGLYGKQVNEKGEAQQSTQGRDKAFDTLFNWYSDFRAIVRVALYEKPQLLESLGIIKK